MAEPKPAQPADPRREPASGHDFSAGELPSHPPVIGWLALVFPLVLAVAILSISPNFKVVDGVRNGSLGGDYLQEWVGGTVAGSAEKAQLYDPAHTRAMQHDGSLLGFEWDPPDSYFPMVYPPFYYQVQRWLAAFDYSTAMRIWTLLSALALSLSAYLLYRFYPPCRPRIGIGIVVGLMYAPLLSSLNMGQKSAFLLLILSATFALLHQRRPFSAGLVFGLIAFKPYLGIVIGVTMLFKRQWRFAMGAVLMVCALVGVALVERPMWWVDYFRVLTQMGDYPQTRGYQLPESHSLWGALQLTLGEWMDPRWIIAIVIGLSLGVIFLLARAMRGPVETNTDRFSFQISAMVFATVILSPHFYTYDLTILLLPMMLIPSSWTPGKWRTDSVTRGLAYGLIGLFVFSGVFATVAEYVRLQPSLGLMVGVLYLLGRSARLESIESAFCKSGCG